MATRKDFTVDSAQVRGDTWFLPFALTEEATEAGVEISLAVRRYYEVPASIYFIITNNSDAVDISETFEATFTVARGLTLLLDITVDEVWYEAKAYDVDADVLITHFFGRIQIIPSGDTTEDPEDPDIPAGSDYQHGHRSGGPLHQLAVASGDAGFLSGADKAKIDLIELPILASAIQNDSAVAGETVQEALEALSSGGTAVQPSRQITAGAGLTGGGDLSADRTINAVPHPDGSIVVNADNIQIGALAADAQHAARGGGLLHAQVISGGDAGFMSGLDKSRLDYLEIIKDRAYSNYKPVPPTVLAPGTTLPPIAGPSAGYIRIFDLQVCSETTGNITALSVEFRVQPANALVYKAPFANTPNTAVVQRLCPIVFGQTLEIKSTQVGGANAIIGGSFYDIEASGLTVVRLALTTTPQVVMPAPPAGFINRWLVATEGVSAGRVQAPRCQMNNVDTVTHGLLMRQGGVVMSRQAQSTIFIVPMSGLYPVIAGAPDVTAEITEVSSTTPPQFVGVYETVPA